MIVYIKLTLYVIIKSGRIKLIIKYNLIYIKCYLYTNYFVTKL